MIKIFFITALSFTVFCATSTAADRKKGPQTIRFYKVNKQQQADRLRFTNKKARQPGCHDLLKRSRVHRIVQIGYAQCQLFTEKQCAAGSVVQASQDNKAEMIEDADKRRQEILTSIILEREAKERDAALEERLAAEEEIRAKMEIEDPELYAEMYPEEEETASADSETDDESDIAVPDAEESEGLEGEGEEEIEIVKRDYEAIEADLKAQLDAVPSREQIIKFTPETIATKLTQGFSWYPESDNLRGVKIRSWSCSLVD